MAPRPGKCLAETATEALVELKPPPRRLFDNYALLAGLGPIICVSGSRPTRSLPSPRATYQYCADGALFTHEDAAETAWAVVDSILDTHCSAHSYKPGRGWPKHADALIAADGRWNNPIPV